MRYPLLSGLWVFFAVATFAQGPMVLDHPFGKGICDKGLKDGDLLHGVADLGLITWDVSDPLHPVRLSVFPWTSPVFDGDIAKAGNTVFLRKGHRVVAVDMEQPEDPVGIPLDLGPGSTSRSIAARGDRLYVATGFGLKIFDVADLAAPAELAFLPLFYLDRIQLQDTMVLGGTGHGFYRIGIGTGVPVLLDSILPPNGPEGNFALNSYASNGRQVCMLMSDFMAGQSRIRLYDLGTVGAPMLVHEGPTDLTEYDALLVMTDSFVIATGEHLTIRGIHGPTVMGPVDTLVSPYTYPTGTAWDANWIYGFNVQGGLSVFDRTSTGTASLYAHHKIGGWVERMGKTSWGQVVTRGGDSLYIFNKEPGPQGDFPYVAHPLQGHDWLVFGDLLVQTRLDGVSSISLWRIHADGGLEPLSTFQSGTAPTNIGRIRIWGDRLYNGRSGGAGEFTNIHDISDPTTPALLVEDFPEFFRAIHDGLLFAVMAEVGMVRIYDASTTPPALLTTKSFEPNCNGGQYGDGQRPRRHFLNGAACHSFLDLSDTTALVSSPMHVLGPIGMEPSTTLVWNDVLYIGVSNQMRLYAYDVCHAEGITPMGHTPLHNSARGIMAMDSLLFVSFGGYITRYDVSGMIACLPLSVPVPSQQAARFEPRPNPSDGRFVLDAPVGLAGGVLRVHDVQGRLVHMERVPVQGDVPWSLRLDLPNGLYLIRADHRGQSATGKLVIE